MRPGVKGGVDTYQMVAAMNSRLTGRQSMPAEGRAASPKIAQLVERRRYPLPPAGGQ